MRTAPAPAAAPAPWVVSIDRADGSVCLDTTSESSASLPGLRAEFSGVLFEPEDLAARLGVAGQPLSSAALLLLAYRQLGDDWLDALAGHFAIIIDDRSRERLVAVRDRMGQHPLFYAETGTTIFFSWSIARLLEQPGVSADFNRVQLAEHLLGRWPVAEETYYAGVRRFFFSLLIRDTSRSPLGADAVSKYANLETPRSLVADHRPDGLSNLEAVTLLTWADLGKVLKEARDSARRTDERGCAERAMSWMQSKGLVSDAG